MIVKIVEKYSSHNWLLVDTYNSILNGFGEKFDDFTPQQLSTIVHAFGSVGLRQEDVLTKSVERIQKLVGDSKRRMGFNKLTVPLFSTFAEVGLTDLPAFETLISDEFNKGAYGEGKTFFDLARQDGSTHDELLAAILKSNLDAKDPRFKQLVIIIQKSVY